MTLTGSRKVAPGAVVSRVCHSFGSQAVLSDVSLEVRPGEVTALLGVNGAGKSTLLRIMSGLLSPDEGRVLFGGEPLHSYSTPGAVAGFVLDPSALHPGRRAEECLRLAAILNHEPRADTAAMLDAVGLRSAARKRVSSLSLGMRQRLALGVALLGRPGTLVLDEPTNGLDIHGIRWVYTKLNEAAAAGAAVLLSSHMLRDVQAHAHRVVVLHEGRIVMDSPMAEVLALNGARCRAEDGALLGRALTAAEIQYIPSGDGAYNVQLTPRELGRFALAHSLSLEMLTARTIELEDLFSDITSSQQGG